MSIISTFSKFITMPAMSTKKLIEEKKREKGRDLPIYVKEEGRASVLDHKLYLN